MISVIKHYHAASDTEYPEFSVGPFSLNGQLSGCETHLRDGLQDCFEQKELSGLKEARELVCAQTLSCILSFSGTIFLLLCFDHSD